MCLPNFAMQRPACGGPLIWVVSLVSWSRQGAASRSPTVRRNRIVGKMLDRC
jgi:hypothetical protein